ncbi:MAG: hypothetical protein F2884_00405 [Actinobacteria bacterium]|uniref:Unannotated protein n=1 Tax=freshwater metagenome TaxID=449393 RepID=A0A6J7N5J8_9ZZZZ|nr:hypothetical protein [Actinomycetota bacterium]MSZ97628.1 hypothetical protein [Actinomycetota bacterium]
MQLDTKQRITELSIKELLVTQQLNTKPQVVERLAVADDVRELLPDSGLVRGRIVRCSGDAGLSLALSLCSLATQQGSWLGVVGVEHLGLLAAVEHGVALERTVLVHPPKTSREWSITVAAAIEGLDLLIVAVPERLSVNDARRVQTRLQSRRAVMIIVDNTVLSQSRSMNGSNEAQQFLADVVLDTKTKSWSGVDKGAGYLQHRDVRIRVSGRRVARERNYLVTRSC